MPTETIPHPAAAHPAAARLDRATPWLILGIAPGMLHAYAVAEALIALIGIAFLARSALLADWSWLRRTWVRIALAWWAWSIFCSLPGIGEGGTPSLVQSLVVGRYLILVAASNTRSSPTPPPVAGSGPSSPPAPPGSASRR